MLAPGVKVGRYRQWLCQRRETQEGGHSRPFDNRGRYRSATRPTPLRRTNRYRSATKPLPIRYQTSIELTFARLGRQVLEITSRAIWVLS
jgi:hypothetical protein